MRMQLVALAGLLSLALGACSVDDDNQPGPTFDSVANAQCEALEAGTACQTALETLQAVLIDA